MVRATRPSYRGLPYKQIPVTVRELMREEAVWCWIWRQRACKSCRGRFNTVEVDLETIEAMSASAAEEVAR